MFKKKHLYKILSLLLVTLSLASCSDKKPVTTTSGQLGQLITDAGDKEDTKVNTGNGNVILDNSGNAVNSGDNAGNNPGDENSGENTQASGTMTRQTTWLDTKFEEEGRNRGQSSDVEEKVKPAPPPPLKSRQAKLAMINYTDINGKNYNGLNFDSSKPMIVFYYVVWCDECKAAMDKLYDFYMKNNDRYSIYFINVVDIYGSSINTEAYARSKGYQFPLYFMNTNTATSLSVTSYPQIMFFSKDQTLKIQYLRPWNDADFQKGLDAISS